MQTSHTIRLEINATLQAETFFAATLHKKNAQHPNTANPRCQPYVGECLFVKFERPWKSEPTPGSVLYEHARESTGQHKFGKI